MPLVAVRPSSLLCHEGPLRGPVDATIITRPSLSSSPRVSSVILATHGGVSRSRSPGSISFGVTILESVDSKKRLEQRPFSYAEIVVAVEATELMEFNHGGWWYWLQFVIGQDNNVNNGFSDTVNLVLRLFKQCYWLFHANKYRVFLEQAYKVVIPKHLKEAVVPQLFSLVMVFKLVRCYSKLREVVM
ncbi:hypothetical protein OPV22_001982 [Ensete ventricosum]|uniref:Uncharacterized protein n=1 Tax=Ensete ventricosum TaxID=4639 RepID=A0AAV8RWM8_ENSVE|nr:hypothetical protein OPV22_001982 [Ensete ventricosum]